MVAPNNDQLDNIGIRMFIDGMMDHLMSMPSNLGTEDEIKQAILDTAKMTDHHIQKLKTQFEDEKIFVMLLSCLATIYGYISEIEESTFISEIKPEIADLFLQTTSIFIVGLIQLKRQEQLESN